MRLHDKPREAISKIPQASVPPRYQESREAAKIYQQVDDLGHSHFSHDAIVCKVVRQMYPVCRMDGWYVQEILGGRVDHQPAAAHSVP